MAEFSHHKACPKCRLKGKDRAGDNLAVYVDESCYCLSCAYTIPSLEWIKKNGGNSKSSYIDEDEEEELDVESMAEKFEVSNWKVIRKKCTHETGGWRGINKNTCQFFDIMNEYSTTTGELVKQYYPCTTGYEISGVRWRLKELNAKGKKDFGSRGITGAASDLHGQWKFKNSNSKIVVITAGEIDQASGHQMFEMTRNKDYEVTPIVSPTSGEGSSAKQLQGQYEWLDTFEKIILCYDNDEAGRVAIAKAVKVLPRGKVYVMKLTLNDTNDYLMAGRHKEWINSFWKAHKYVPEGITSSKDLEDKMIEYVSVPRLTLPSFMHRMQKMLAGGFPFGYIINILAASGVGKSTFVDAMISHWIMNNPKLVGIVSLEASEGEYGVNLSSSYCGFKINLLESVQEKLDYLSLPENIEKRKRLWSDEAGDPRFYLVDADVENMKDKIEYLVVSLGCKIIVLDPIQDILDELDDKEQARWMKWEKDMVKREGVIIININHARKSGGGVKANSRGAVLSEEDMHGHSSIFKSGGVNIILGRDKEAESELEKNTTIARITKARGVGRTGLAGEYFYDNPTHSLSDLHDWLEKNPVPITDPKDKKFSMKKA